MLLVMSVSIHKHMKQNNFVKRKPRIEMRKMAGNSPGILALLTAPPLKVFLEGAAVAVA